MKCFRWENLLHLPRLHVAASIQRVPKSHSPKMRSSGPRVIESDYKRKQCGRLTRSEILHLPMMHLLREIQILISSDPRRQE